MKKTDIYKDFKIEDAHYDKKEIACSIAFKCLLIVVSVFGLIMDFSALNSFLVGLTYFGTFISFMCLIIVSLFMVLDVIRFCTKKDFRIRVLYIIKFILTVSSVFSMFFICALVAPAVFTTFGAENFSLFGNIFSYILCPLLLVFDFMEFDYNFNSKFISSLYGIIPFSIHYLVILFISLFSDFKWKSYASGITYLKMPYSVLDYSLPENSWRSDQKAILSIEKGTVGINQIFLLVLFLIVIVGIGTLLLYLKNRRFIKIYNIKKEDSNLEKEN